MQRPQLLEMAKQWMKYNQTKTMMAIPSLQQQHKTITRVIRNRKFLDKLERMEEFVRRFECIGKVMGHTYEVLCLSFDKANKRIITGSNDWMLKVWDLETGWLLRTLRGHTGEVEFINVNHENTMVASGATDGTVRVWSLYDGYPCAVLKTPTVPHPVYPDTYINRVTAVLWTNTKFEENRYLIAGFRDDGKVRMYHWKPQNDVQIPGYFNETPIELILSTRKNDYPVCLSLDSAGIRLLVGGTDGLVRLYLISTQKCIGHLEHSSALVDVHFSNKGTRFISSTHDGLVYIWSYKNEWTKQILNDTGKKKRADSRVILCCWLKDDAYVCTAHANGHVRVYNSYSGSLKQEMRADGGKRAEILTLEPHPQHKEIFLSATYEQGYVAIWHINYSECLWSYKFDGQIGDAQFSWDGLSLIIAQFCKPDEQYVHIFGLGRQKLDCPVEQFFHSDFELMDNNRLQGHNLPIFMEQEQYIRPRHGCYYSNQPNFKSRKQSFPLKIKNNYNELISWNLEDCQLTDIEIETCIEKRISNVQQQQQERAERRRRRIQRMEPQRSSNRRPLRRVRRIEDNDRVPALFSRTLIVESEDEEQKPYPLWTEMTQDSMASYYPQVGDTVVYIREGHEAFLKYVKETLFYPEYELEHPHGRRRVITTTVEDIKVESVNNRFLITLSLSDSREFKIKYEDVNFTDFVLLKSRFDSSPQHLEIMDKVNVLMDKMSYSAKIISRSDQVWQKYGVVYEDGVQDRVSPWELDFEFSKDQREQLRSSLVRSTMNVLNKLSHDDVFVCFDNRPISTNLIIKRLDNKYYRHKDELIRDLLRLQSHPNHCLNMSLRNHIDLNAKRFFSKFY